MKIALTIILLFAIAVFVQAAPVYTKVDDTTMRISENIDTVEDITLANLKSLKAALENEIVILEAEVTVREAELAEVDAKIVEAEKLGIIENVIAISP